MKNRHFIAHFLILFALVLLTNCLSYEKANPQLVERLNSQIKDEEYDRIYSESSDSAKSYKYSKQEFIERLKQVREQLSAIDESVEFQQLQERCGDEGVYRADNFACRYIEKNGRRIDIDIWLDATGGRLNLLDLCIYSDDMDDKFCVSDASRS